MTIINEEKEFRELKEIIKVMNSQRSDTGKINLIEKGKKKQSYEEVIKHNEVIKVSLFKVQKKCRKYKSRRFKN